MKIELNQSNQKLQYTASTENASIEVGANKFVADNEKSFRPMELLLVSLASCSAIDIELILEKQKQKYKSFSVKVEGERRDEIPSVYEEINLQITVEGNVSRSKLERAIQLTKEKYCSVFHCLHPEIVINYSSLILHENE